MKKVEWLSYIKLNKGGEVQIQSCFECAIAFHYLKNILEFDDIIEELKVRSRASETTTDFNDKFDYVNYFYDENNQLIVMDVSGLADRSEKFTSFLNVAQKFRYHCVYILRYTS